MIKWLKEFKVLVGVIVFIFLGGIAFAGWAKLPKKVTDNTAHINKVANTVNTYVTEQKAIQKQKEKSDKEYKEMLHKWIEAVSSK